jgi:hypothetical protein
MANMNLFEKYGIKEVADVTFYRIEKQNETYESQREITAATILKGALELQMVYPMNEDGEGGQDGFEAYVFADAQIISDETSEHNHEYSYEKQILNLFAKNQNLIAKTGTRYEFTDEGIFEDKFEFSHDFAVAPNSTERVVVVGLTNALSDGLYSSEEVNTAIKALTYTLKAKAYDVVYKDYAELIVADEMGYFDPTQIGTGSNRDTGKITGSQTDVRDSVIKNVTMWNADNCKSINDAILALRQKKGVLDVAETSAFAGISDVQGGYTVGEKTTINGTDATGEYAYDGYTVENTGYSLDSVLKALAEIAVTASGAAVTVNDGNGVDSNRAIYVKVGGVDMAASSYVYLLRNVNYKKLSQDTAGVFKFTSKITGEDVYYKDEIFAGEEFLALVIVGDKGLIFKVGRHGERKIEKMGWMVNQNGYLTTEGCAKVVDNGLIHICDTTVFEESFDAVCTVSSLKVRKTKKRVNRYVPVLFLDTLKVSTIEQTAESSNAEGGRGNGKLITWDYGKEITVTLEDALYSPASMSAMLGSYEGNDFTKGVKETKRIDRTEKCTATRSFIVPAGNSKGVPSEGDTTAQSVYIEIATMQPYQDGAPIAEGETYLKWTRSIAYGDNSLGTTIEISADKFPGTYKVVGDTFARNKDTGEDQRFQFVIPQAKMSSEQTITLEAGGDPSVFSMDLTVLRPDDGIMLKLIQYDVVENTEENDGSTMIKNTENLNLLDGAEMFKVTTETTEETGYIGATEY